jgi:hypothetical protein
MHQSNASLVKLIIGRLVIRISRRQATPHQYADSVADEAPDHGFIELRPSYIGEHQVY